jgi:hypothetical protein
VLAVPVTVGGGVYVTDRTAVMFQYGLVAHYSPNKDAERQLFGSDIVHRFRFAAERTWFSGPVRVDGGAHIDLFSGSERLQGTVIGVYVGLQLWAQDILKPDPKAE